MCIVSVAVIQLAYAAPMLDGRMLSEYPKTSSRSRLRVCVVRQRDNRTSEAGVM
jgi:hypothetical protein